MLILTNSNSSTLPAIEQAIPKKDV
jgi:hypothetical protein